MRWSLVAASVAYAGCSDAKPPAPYIKAAADVAADVEADAADAVGQVDADAVPPDAGSLPDDAGAVEPLDAMEADATADDSVESDSNEPELDTNEPDAAQPDVTESDTASGIGGGGVVVRGSLNRWPKSAAGARVCAGKVCIVGGVQ